MKNTVSPHTGRHFLQIPGPTNVPDRVLQAIAMPTIDHRGPEFALLGQEIVAGMKRVFQTDDDVVVYPSSGTGAWEAALSNTLSPGDRVLMFETGHFATLWRQMATRLGLEIDFVPGDWRHGADPALVEEKLVTDKEHAVKAVCVVHNETSTGVTSRVAEIREAIDRARHPALHGRHDLLARLDRLSPRSLGCRRHRRRIPERADATAGARLQCGFEKGVGGP
jgi:alanine-glyoxylate transaminase/serine-glyoxylate transaminase/serine-pyruvate transaminase